MFWYRQSVRSCSDRLQILPPVVSQLGRKAAKPRKGFVRLVSRAGLPFDGLWRDELLCLYLGGNTSLDSAQRYFCSALKLEMVG